MILLKCKTCGGTIQVIGENIGQCDRCGSKVVLPRMDDDIRMDMYNRGNYFRSIYEFDKAAAAFEQIIAQDPHDAEAYFSLVLSNYGVEYVRDPRTGEYKPTIHKARMQSILNDPDYLKALEYAHPAAAPIYRYEVGRIHEIQQHLLDICRDEKPYDVFICYKESLLPTVDPAMRNQDSGSRTLDSVIAQDIYDQLTDSGLRVFFSRITLQDKLGTAYEPYIFAALNSATVMVVVGTEREHVEAVWVKNEWSRYLELMKKDHNKTLIPVIKGMDEYDLPDQLADLRPQDLSKTGVMQDLIRGIIKITGKTEAKNILAKSRELEEYTCKLLDEGKYAEAKTMADQMLNLNAESGKAFLYHFLAEYEVSSLKGLVNDSRSHIEENRYLINAQKYATGDLKKEINDFIAVRRQAQAYEDGLAYMKSCKFGKALESFHAAESYKDAPQKAEEARQKADKVAAAKRLEKNKNKYADELDAVDDRVDEYMKEKHQDMLMKSSKLYSDMQLKKAPAAKWLCTLLSIVIFVLSFYLFMKGGESLEELEASFFGIMYGLICSTYIFGRVDGIVRHFLPKGCLKVFVVFMAGGMFIFPFWLLTFWEEKLMLLVGFTLVNMVVSVLWYLKKAADHGRGVKAEKAYNKHVNETIPAKKKEIRDRMIEEIRAEYKPLIGPENL